jgi:hypothetical protein
MSKFRADEIQGISLQFSSEFLTSSLLSTNTKIVMNTSIIMPVVLKGFETSSPALRKLHRLMVFENRVLKNNWE